MARSKLTPPWRRPDNGYRVAVDAKTAVARAKAASIEYLGEQESIRVEGVTPVGDGDSDWDIVLSWIDRAPEATPSAPRGPRSYRDPRSYRTFLVRGNQRVVMTRTPGT